MKQRLIYGLVSLALLVNLLIGARIYLNSAQAAEKDSAYPSLELFSYVMEKVRKDYVDGQKLTYQELVYGALKGMLNTLDPHSEFMDPEKYKELQNDTQGAFGGLGVVISMKDNFVTVVAPMEDTPGFQAGILSGDRIIRIEGKSTEKMSLQDAVKTLRGDPGTQVTITIFRPSSSQVKDYRLTRAVINIDMVKDINGKKEFPLGEDKLGYVRLVQFGEKTSDDLEAALKKLTAQGMQALVLDLRWNPRAIILGEKTFGKGSVQSILPLADGSALRLTTAKYYTPSHKVIHEEGITPDIYVPLSPEEDRDIQLRRTPGGVESLDEKQRDQVLESRDPQLDRAMDLLKGITLFTQRAPAPEKRLARGEKVAAK